MKKITLLLILVLTFGLGHGQTTLSAGDIVITGFNSDNPDQVKFVLLTDVQTGTIIHFTDSGWKSTGVFNTPANGGNNEGVITWIADSDLTCGTEIIILNTSSNNYSSSHGIVSETDANFGLSTAGDQILAYQGTEAAPTFIFAVHFDGTSGWSTDATSTNTSALPMGLTNGVNAVAIDETDGARYNCSVLNNSSLILSAVSESSNWIRSNVIIPLGSCTYTCGDCATVVTWDGTSWDAPPTTNTFAVIDGDYTATTANSFSSCSLYINEISSSTSNPITVRVNNGGYIEVENDVIVNGTLIVESQGNFVQRDDAGTFTVNTGGASRVNKTTASKSAWYYYTYWSSPVVDETIGNVFTDVDGDRRFWFNASNFIDTNGDNIDDDANAWQYALAGNTITPGVGYAVTESRLFGAFGLPATGTASFEGEFNTGNINVAISNNPANVGAGTTSWNFIGNPYPSAIDFDAFYTANSAVIGGTAYFWSQATDHAQSNGGNEQSNFSQNDYAMYAAGSGAGVAGASGEIPNQYIPSGQGFFISGLDNNSATFTNAMRMADNTSNALFFKGSKKTKTTTPENKLWVNLTSNNGVFNQILIAYVNGATNGFDGDAYDAKRFLASNFHATLYSTIENSNNKFAIQGKAINSLTESEVINLGFATHITDVTTYKLSIAKFKGDFITNNTIYLKDNLLNVMHNLSDADYTFTSEVGEFNNRFEIRFSPKVLFTETIEANTNRLKIVELENNAVKFTASSHIKTVKIYDLLGRELYKLEGNNKTETYNLSKLNASVFIAKVELSNGLILTKKAVKK
ncbi:hypothetical protein [Algibacter sp. PT7-4]|uniref:hypothetical protein n=1 Tax=Algibacter ulvanivorans TaxID=3400999 RepID=UPI003AAEBCC1